MKDQAKYLREWRLKHPGKASEHNKRYKERHPDRVIEQRAKERAKYIKKGRYRVSEEHKKMVHRNNARKWREKNKEKVRKSAQKCYFKNKNTLKWKTYKRNYKGKKRAGDDKTINPKSLVELLENQKNICAIGGDILGIDKELDHKIPISKGGRHTLENVQWVCRFHNRSKGNKT